MGFFKIFRPQNGHQGHFPKTEGLLGSQLLDFSEENIGRNFDNFQKREVESAFKMIRTMRLYIYIHIYVHVFYIYIYIIYILYLYVYIYIHIRGTELARWNGQPGISCRDPTKIPRSSVAVRPAIGDTVPPQGTSAF